MMLYSELMSVLVIEIVSGECNFHLSTEDNVGATVIYCPVVYDTNNSMNGLSNLNWVGGQ